MIDTLIILTVSGTLLVLTFGALAAIAVASIVEAVRR